MSFLDGMSRMMSGKKILIPEYFCSTHILLCLMQICLLSINSNYSKYGNKHVLEMFAQRLNLTAHSGGDRHKKVPSCPNKKASMSKGGLCATK